MSSALIEALSASEPELLHRARTVTLRAGERLCLTGDRDLGVYIVRSGVLKLMGNSASGRESIICLAWPGELVGEVAAFDGRPQPLDVVAAGRTELLALSSQSLLRVLLRSPQVAFAVGTLMARRNRWMCEATVERSIRNAPARLAGRLLGLARQFDSEDGVPIHIGLPLAQGDIGKLAGLSRESACRALKSFREAGAVDFRRPQLKILDPEALELIRNTDM
ncbi:MAG TPA: Crp/Fnr family transcriptional regulator [Actinomycetota bacterium]|nr:Crp/Fnr family transcriptional regulator [Actinomycetota bacterium]